MRGKTECRGCGSTNLFQALDLGYSPLANRVISSDQLESAEPWFPLVLRICSVCGLGQLGEFTSDATIFRQYPYLSSTSSSWLTENRHFADKMTKLLQLNPDDLVLELASNDGYLLQYFMEKDISVLGIEPALNVATIAALKGIPTSPEFFTSHVASALSSRGVQPKLIVAKNVVAHVPNLIDFLEGIAILAAESTLVVIEAPGILNILQKMQFDTIYHEHFSYLSATFLMKVLPAMNLKLVGLETVKTHGGSMRFYVTQSNSLVDLPIGMSESLHLMLELERTSGFQKSATWHELGIRVNIALSEIRSWFSTPSSRVIGYGAAAKAVTLLSAAQIPRGTVSMCIDNSPEKISHYIPGSHIRIVSELEYIANHSKSSDTFVIFPWNLEQEISQKIRKFNAKARIFVLLPTIREIYE
jgi:hypothetical protein